MAGGAEQLEADISPAPHSWKPWHGAAWSCCTATLFAALLLLCVLRCNSEQPGAPGQLLGCTTDHTPSRLCLQLAAATETQKPGGKHAFLSSQIFNCENVLPSLFKPREMKTAGEGAAPQKSIPGTPLSP